MGANAAVETHQLTKTYPGRSTPALNDLSLSVEHGEIFGYLGPNGAGKSTTIRLMLDFIRPSSGSVRIFGMDVQAQSRQVRQYVGNLPGELRLWDHLTGRQILAYLTGLRPGCDLQFAYELAERLDLDLNLKAGKYSTGNKRKVGIIQAMMHRPPLLVLDEPTNGLDPLVRQTFHGLLLEARERGQTVFLSSHVLSEVQDVCDRVAILRDGVLQMVNSVSELQLSLQRIVTIYSHDVLMPGAWAALDGVQHVEPGEGYIRLRITGSLDSVVKYAACHAVHDLTVETPRLEQIFMDYYHD